MNYIFFTIKHWPLSIAGLVLANLAWISAYAGLVKIVASLANGDFSIGTRLIPLVLISVTFLIVPIAVFFVSLTINAAAHKSILLMLEKPVVTEGSSSFHGRACVVSAENGALPARFLSIPLGVVLFFCLIWSPNFPLFVTMAFSALPLAITFGLGFSKRINAEVLVNSQRDRSVNFERWNNTGAKGHFPRNAFSKELRVRRLETYLDESLSIIPSAVALACCLTGWGIGWLSLSDMILVFSGTQIFVQGASDLADTVGKYVRVNGFFTYLSDGNGH